MPPPILLPGAFSPDTPGGRPIMLFLKPLLEPGIPLLGLGAVRRGVMPVDGLLAVVAARA